MYLPLYCTVPSKENINIFIYIFDLINEKNIKKKCIFDFFFKKILVSD